jgi:hypothetical protein
MCDLYILVALYNYITYMYEHRTVVLQFSHVHFSKCLQVQRIDAYALEQSNIFPPKWQRTALPTRVYFITVQCKSALSYIFVWPF